MNDQSLNFDTPAADAPTRALKGASDTNIQPSCPRCGGKLAESALDGLCQKCLLLAGLSEGDDDDTLGEKTKESVGLGRFGDFNLLEEIARGGMGIVYRAKQISLNRIVAIKMILSSHLASETDIERFYTEAKAAASLDHSSIVPIYEIGEVDGQHYYVMPFINGTNYAQMLIDGSAKLRQTVEILEQVARAVDFAHQHDIIHRDLKPANILIDSDQQPKITDFGLAKILNEGTEHTRSGQLMGTPSYMSPEQATGEEITAASDVYSLGAMLYAGVCGRPPFQGDGPLDVIMQVRNKEPVALRTLNPRTPQDLETICLKCLEKNPAKRYASALEVADELRRYLKSEPIVARPIRKSERAVRWCYRNPVVAALGTAIVLLLIAGLSSVVALWQRAEFHLQESERNQKNSQYLLLRARDAELEMRGERNRTQLSLNKAEENLYLTRVSLAQQKWRDNHVEQANYHLQLCPPNLRDWEWYYLNRICNLESMTIHADDGAIVSMAVDADGDYVAGGFRNGTLRIWDLRDGRVIHEIPAHGAPISSVEFSQDGTAIATAGVDRTTKVWNLVDGTLRYAPRHHDNYGRRVVNVPRTNWFANLAYDGTIDLVDWDTGEVMRSTKIGNSPAGLAFDETGRFMVTCAAGELCVFRVNQQDFEAPIAVLPVEGVITDVTINPAGDKVAITGGVIDPETRVFDWESQTELLRLRGHSLQCIRVRFSADGESILTTSRDKSIRIYSALDGTEIKRVRGHGHVVTDAVYRHDDQTLISSSDDGTIRVWDNESMEIGETRRVSTMLRLIRLTPDKQRIVIASWNGDVHLFDAMTGEPVGEIPRQAASLTDMAITADSQRMYYVEPRESIRLQSLKDPTKPSEIIVDDLLAQTLVLTKNENSLIVGSFDGTVQRVSLDDTSDRETIYQHDSIVWRLTMSEDGKFLASIDIEGRLVVWDLVNKKKHLDMVAHDEKGDDVLFHPHLPFLASAGNDGKILIINYESGEIVHQLFGHSFGVSALSFHPSSARLASAGMDFTIKVWDLHSGIELLNIQTHRRQIYDVEFSADGKYIDSVDVDGMWIRHRGASDDEIAEGLDRTQNASADNPHG